MEIETAVASEEDIAAIRGYLAEIRTHVGGLGALDSAGETLVEELILYMAERELNDVMVDGRYVTYDLWAVEIVRGKIAVSPNPFPRSVLRMTDNEYFHLNEVGDETLIGMVY